MNSCCRGGEGAEAIAGPWEPLVMLQLPEFQANVEHSWRSAGSHDWGTHVFFIQVKQEKGVGDILRIVRLGLSSSLNLTVILLNH